MVQQQAQYAAQAQAMSQAQAPQAAMATPMRPQYQNNVPRPSGTVVLPGCGQPVQMPGGGPAGPRAQAVAQAMVYQQQAQRAAQAQAMAQARAAMATQMRPPNQRNGPTPSGSMQRPGGPAGPRGQVMMVRPGMSNRPISGQSGVKRSADGQFKRPADDLQERIKKQRVGVEGNPFSR